MILASAITNKFTKAHTLAEIYKLAIVDKYGEKSEDENDNKNDENDNDENDENSSDDSDVSARGYTN